MQGQTLEVVSEVAANAPGDTVGAVVCNIESPAGWEILDRRYEEYGWFQDDGAWDHSVPSAPGDPAIPGVPGNDPWPDTTAADFRFETIRANFANLPAGVHILETIQIAVPADTLPGFYSFGFGYLEASDIDGSLDLVETADTFTLTVIPVPEPSTALLVLATTSLLMIPARKGHRRHPPIFH